jgi:hypothetical protein
VRNQVFFGIARRPGVRLHFSCREKTGKNGKKATENGRISTY